MTKVSEKKVKKRKWYEILSKDFNNVVLGEIITKDPNSVLNRTLKVNLGNLTRDIKLQNVDIVFRITKFEEDKFYTEIYGYGLNSSYVKRIIKSTKTKIDDSFVCTSKDGIKVRIKPLILTRNNVNRSIITSLIKKNRELFNDHVSKKDYKDFFKDLSDKKLCIELKKTMSKIYPLSVFEVRVMRRLG
ncbi:MAG: hypothetical protein ISS82_01165 [Nanoarchaeota archaeon]|nr:hypothetical protein [Nanoarchaeota archaeon]